TGGAGSRGSPAASGGGGGNQPRPVSEMRALVWSEADRQADGEQRARACSPAQIEAFATRGTARQRLLARRVPPRLGPPTAVRTPGTSWPPYRCPARSTR